MVVVNAIGNYKVGKLFGKFNFYLAFSMLEALLGCFLNSV